MEGRGTTETRHREGGREGNGPDLVIRGGTVLTMVEGAEPLKGAWVCVSRGRITDIVEADRCAEYRDTGAAVIDAAGGIVMPGLINAHTHSAMTLFRGFADDMPLKEWLFEKIFPAEAAHLTPDTVYWGTLLACLEMIASGTTCIADGYFFEEHTARAVHESGLRGLVAQGVIDFPAPGVENPKDNVTVAAGFLDRWREVSQLVTPGIFCHSPVTCSADTLVGAHRVCRDYGVPLQIHLSETAGEVEEVERRTGMRPVRYLERTGLLDGGLIAVHAVHLDDDEIRCLADHGVMTVHAPESNMKLASGVAPVTSMRRCGLTVGLGTDGCASNNNLDMFQEMDSAAKLSKVFDADPVGLDARTVLSMATAGGAEVLGLDGIIGTLETGSRADIIVVDTGSPHLCPLYDPFSALVYSACGGDVKDVVVDGRVLMKNRVFTTLDPGEILRRVRRICAHINV